MENAKAIVKNFFATINAKYYRGIFFKSIERKGGISADSLKLAFETGQALVEDIMKENQLQPKESEMEKKIKIYSTPTCPYCVRAKEYLKQKNFTFEDIDVSLNNEAVEELIHKSGQIGVPVIEIDGEIIVGFDKEKMNKALGIN